MSKLSHPRSSINKYAERIVFAGDDEEARRLVAEATEEIARLERARGLRPATVRELESLVNGAYAEFRELNGLH